MTEYDVNDTMAGIAETAGFLVPLSTNTTEFNILLALTLAVGIPFVFSEILPGVHISYSKFARQDVLDESVALWRTLFSKQMAPVPGFLILYGLPLVGILITVPVLFTNNYETFGRITRQQDPSYMIVLSAMLLATFVKRELEVVCVHIYSGGIPVLSSIAIGFGYSLLAVLSLLASSLVEEYPGLTPDSPTFIKDVACIAAFVICVSLNALMHYQLRQIRLRGEEEKESTGEKRYYAPSEIGKFFSWFICPHYLFEFIAFSAILIYGGTIIHYMFVVIEASYLGLRTRSTYKWYQKRGLIGPEASKSLVSQANIDI